VGRGRSAESRALIAKAREILETIQPATVRNPEPWDRVMAVERAQRQSLRAVMEGWASIRGQA
jgi:hypothetical protein